MNVHFSSINFPGKKNEPTSHTAILILLSYKLYYLTHMTWLADYINLITINKMYIYTSINKIRPLDINADICYIIN